MSIKNWKTAHDTLFKSMQTAKAEYSFFLGRRFLLSSGESVSLWRLESRIEDLFKKTSLFKENEKRLSKPKIDDHSRLSTSEQVQIHLQACFEHIEIKTLYDSPENRMKWIELVQRLDRESDAEFYKSNPSFFMKISLKMIRFFCHFCRKPHQIYRPDFSHVDEINELTRGYLTVMELNFKGRAREFLFEAQTALNDAFENAKEALFTPSHFALSAQDCLMFYSVLDWMKKQLHETSLLAYEPYWPQSFQQIAANWQKISRNISEELRLSEYKHLELLKIIFQEKKPSEPVYITDEKGDLHLVKQAPEDAENQSVHYFKNAIRYLIYQSIDRLKTKIELEKLEKLYQDKFPEDPKSQKINTT